MVDVPAVGLERQQRGEVLECDVGWCGRHRGDGGRSGVGGAHGHEPGIGDRRALADCDSEVLGRFLGRQLRELVAMRLQVGVERAAPGLLVALA